MFFALEGQHVESRGELWRLEVCSVYSNGIDYWVQLDLSGPVRCGLTVRTPRPDAQGVLAIVGAWLDDSVPSHVEECLVGKTYSPAVRL